MKKKGQIQGSEVFLTMIVFGLILTMFSVWSANNIIKQNIYNDLQEFEINDPTDLFKISNILQTVQIIIDNGTISPWLYPFIIVFLSIPLILAVMYYVRGFI